MKILQIFPGKVWGGAEQYILDLGMALTKEGHEVRYACRDTGVVASRLEGKVDFFRIPFGKWCRTKAARAIAPLLEGMDVVNIHDTSFVGAVVDARRISGSNAKIVMTRHIARGSRVPFWRRGAFRHIDKFVFVSQLAKDMWMTANRWIPEEKCSVVLNSVPDVSPGDSDTAGSLRHRYGISPQTPLLMFTGRVRKSKGCEVIIRSLGRLRDRDFALIFVGDAKPADYPAKLSSIASEEGIAERIFFHGFSSDVPSLIREADIGLAPSIVREACGLSPMEFMKSGKCVVATDNGAQKEYVTHGETGFLVAPGDADALAAVLKPLLPTIASSVNDAAVAESRVSSRQRRESIGEKAREYASRNLSYQAFVKKITGVYEAN